jgi:hypothetical protein
MKQIYENRCNSARNKYSYTSIKLEIQPCGCHFLVKEMFWKFCTIKLEKLISQKQQILELNDLYHNFFRYVLTRIYSEFFLRLAIGFYMLIFQPPVNFYSVENIQTIFGIKLEDFLNYRIDYNSISQTVEKVVKKIFLGRRNNSTSSGRQSSAIVGSTKASRLIK